MIEYVCTECPFQAEGLDDLQRHSQDTGHVGINVCHEAGGDHVASQVLTGGPPDLPAREEWRRLAAVLG